MTSVSVTALKTKTFSVGENLVDFIDASVDRKLISENMILAITSKIVSLAENRLVDRSSIDKNSLVKKEADVFLGELNYGSLLTIKHGLLIASAGIDESNSKSGAYILYPQDPFRSAQNLWQDLRKKWSIQNLGLLLTDSHTSPLRRGVTGICLSYWGFKPIKNMIGGKDLFGRELQMTQINYADALASMAVMVMGEGSESQPLAVIHYAPVEFSDHSKKEDLLMPLEQDLYAPFMKSKSIENTRDQS